MASLERGTKRQCLYCGTKFYDLNKDPILCPNCGKAFAVIAAKPVVRVVPESKEEETVHVDKAAVEAGAEVISLDEAETEDDGDDIPDVEDVEVDDELGGDDDDVFLEEDEDDDEIKFAVNSNDDEV